MKFPKDDPDVQAFFKDFEENCLPKLKDSAMTACIFNPNKIDAKICLEMGASLLLDKPIIVIVEKGAKIPSNLEQIGIIIETSGDISSPENQKKIQEAFTSVINRLEEKEQ